MKNKFITCRLILKQSMQTDWIGILGVIAVLCGGGFLYYTARRSAKERSEVKAARLAINYPLQLQAAERMVLFLERIKPQNLLTRLGVEHAGPTELQQKILQEIRTELDHNTAQQLYLGKETWRKITTAATTTSGALVHAVAERAAMSGTKEIIVSILQHEDEAVRTLIEGALDAIKEEVQQNF